MSVSNLMIVAGIEVSTISFCIIHHTESSLKSLLHDQNITYIIHFYDIISTQYSIQY